MPCFPVLGPKGAAEAGGEEDERTAALYSVIHLRSYENYGKQRLRKVAKRTGCDPVAALEMRPEYIKSILAPLDLLAHPVVVISDGQEGSNAALARLQSDPDIGLMVRVVPEGARWVVGDITLAVMATAFIGNPISTMSVSIARARVALGFEQSYLHRVKDEEGEWTTVCGDLFLC